MKEMKNPYVKQVEAAYSESGRIFLETLRLQPQYKKTFETIDGMNIKEKSNLAIKIIEGLDNGSIDGEENAELFAKILLASIGEYVRKREVKQEERK